MSIEKKFVSIISDLGFDIKKPIDITSSGNENGTTLAVIMQGQRDYYWRSDLRLATLKHLINQIDIKRNTDDDFEEFQKYILTILDTIGNVIAWNAPYDEKRNIENVRRFIEDSLESPRVLLQAEREGLIDQTDDDDGIKLVKQIQ